MPYIRVQEVNDYLLTNKKVKISEFALRKRFAYPLAKQNMLNQHDPVAYITGMMTQLKPQEMIAFQIVISPTSTSETDVISEMILRNEDVLAYLDRFQLPWYFAPVTFVVNVLGKCVQAILWVINDFSLSKDQRYAMQNAQYMDYQVMAKVRPARQLSSFEQDLITSIQKKSDQLLFETTIRAYVSVEDSNDRTQRIKGIRSALAPFSVPKYQSLRPRYNIFPPIVDTIRNFVFHKRVLSFFTNKSSSLLSESEIADLYHFPFTNITKTENLAKVYSKVLPAPTSLKNNRALSVIFGKNTYGNTETLIGLTKEERETHQFIVGRTGGGKTTLMSAMAKHDIEEGEGMAFVDPHGDVSKDLIYSIPENRKNDLIYLNPIDLKHPVRINLLELTPGLDEDEAELEKEVVCEGVISLFRKVFSKEENANAHRIEYILRNTIYTAFTVKDPTLFTLYEILNNPPFQKKITSQLEDENLKNFWKFEFGRAGDYQVVKMVSGVTAKIGRFLFSPTAKRILEEPKSTINFDDIMNQGKILICNFSQGNLGEDTARLLGTMVLTKIQQAALRRDKLPKEKRRAFYLYVDEFQNFATHSFIKMLSEGRKYGLSVCMAEQSTSQQEEKTIVKKILANVTTVICFRTANAEDADLMLTQFAPYVDQADIVNLPRYNFYIKISAIEPEEPFSGITIYTPVIKDEKRFKMLIDASQKNYATVYVKKQKEVQAKAETTIKEDKKSDPEKPVITGSLPKKRK